MTDPVTAATIFQSLINAGTAIANTADAAKRQAQLIEFQKAITQAFATIAELQLSNAALLSDKSELKQEIVKLKDWATEREKYELKEIISGVFARVDKGYVGGLRSAHKFCPTCFDALVKSTLQQSAIDHRTYELCCAVCKAKTRFSHGYSDGS